MTGTTTRTVTFSVVDHATRALTDTRSYPAGTRVYATPTRGGLIIRVPGTLYTQTVALSVVAPA